MEQNQEPIQQLTEIRNLMERSSRFISLSGLSGVSAGIAALAGALAAYFHLGPEESFYSISAHTLLSAKPLNDSTLLFLLADAGVVLLFALLSGIYFTTRKARKEGLKVWDHAARRMIVNLLIPLITGGFFCLILLYHHLYWLLAPATLIFYGLALLNASKYTFHEIRVLGLAEIFLGLVAGWLAGYGLLLWAVGFGIMHIFYGMMMYFRHEAVKTDGK
jgi:hypothetical protein